VTPDGQQVISGSEDNTVKIWDLATGKNYTPSQVIVTGFIQYVSHPMVKQVISGSGDKTVKIWDLATGKELRTLTGHSELGLVSNSDTRW
jgi:hypothetical protein